MHTKAPQNSNTWAWTQLHVFAHRTQCVPQTKKSKARRARLCLLFLWKSKPKISRRKISDPQQECVDAITFKTSPCACVCVCAWAITRQNMIFYVYYRTSDAMYDAILLHIRCLFYSLRIFSPAVCSICTSCAAHISSRTKHRARSFVCRALNGTITPRIAYILMHCVWMLDLVRFNNRETE